MTLFFVLSLLQLLGPQNWETVRFDECSFSIDLPADEGVIPEIDAVETTNGMGYSLSVSRFHIGCMHFDDGLLENHTDAYLAEVTLAGIVTSQDLTLEYVSDSSITSSEGKEFKGAIYLKEDDPIGFVVGRIFLVENNIVQLLDATFNGAEIDEEKSEAESKKFFDSFEIH